ncbi:hypothetical protein D3C71_1890550 [compost metagenome]
MIRIADVHAHRQPMQLAHEVILQSGPDDLLAVVQIFRTDEPDDCVHDERLKSPGKPVASRFQRHLVDAEMGA